ncbi:GDSL-like Lipase/Acylhydrolase [Tistlia consotensis]|uniref:GDSL-like Lipase/Acylhydrolase n=1 Tax=Tistlia consotensis USBA 355 TaxID=560819 RepID=A0A1Y6CUP3_9PROT|nr:hypothetical protein [Tistlia consotensis]SMF76133.1 GDSL-like Lipase/Acylhydrolase [Tistlia consotensis USBA 355]SNS12292.1 GDSL-like Lipase/Acylhydrolase [Tistlia consotensis]
MAVDLPASYKNPPLMAIGDSMYQGVRSLTMSAPLFRFSPPAQVARALGLDEKAFSYPDPLRPLIIDMEPFIRLLPDLGAIDQLLSLNARYWTRRPSSGSGRLAFENVSVASMDIGDLYAFDWERRSRQADALKYKDASSIKGLSKAQIPDGGLADALLGLNARFTLNPSGSDALEGVQPVELVKLREPEILLLNIGSNEGLFDAGFEGNPNLTDQRVAEIGKRYEILADHLKEVGPGTRKIIVNGLVLPSQVPNLMPAPESISYSGHLPGPDGYFDNYENRMGFGYGTMTGQELKWQDERVAAINANMAETMRQRLGDRVEIVDLAEQMRHLNRKHQRLSDDNVIKAGGVSISNMMLESYLGGGFRWGGFCGLDGMHPSVVGYGRIAKEVLKKIGRGGEKVDYEACFRSDSLLTDLPGLWTEIMFLYRDYRRATAKPKDAQEKARIDTLAAVAGTAPGRRVPPAPDR